DLGTPSEFDLGEPGLRLDPAEHLLDPLAADLADPIAGMTGGAAVDRCLADPPMLADRTVDGDVGRYLAAAQVFDESGHVVCLVGAERDATASLAPVKHGERRLPLRRP